MSTTTSYRLCGIALILGSVLSITYSVSQAFIAGPFPQALADPVAVIGSLIGFLGAVLVLLGFPGVYTRQAKPAGILGLFGFLLTWYVLLFHGILIPFTSVTIVPLLASDPTTRHLLAAGPLASFAPFNDVGLVGQTVGLLLLALATLRARIFPRWSAWLLFATLVLNVASLVPFAPDALGNMAIQLGYVALIGYGYALLAQRSRESLQTVPV